MDGRLEQFVGGFRMWQNRRKRPIHRKAVPGVCPRPFFTEVADATPPRPGRPRQRSSRTSAHVRDRHAAIPNRHRLRQIRWKQAPSPPKLQAEGRTGEFTRMFAAPDARNWSTQSRENSSAENQRTLRAVCRSNERIGPGPTYKGGTGRITRMFASPTPPRLATRDSGANSAAAVRHLSRTLKRKSEDFNACLCTEGLRRGNTALRRQQ